MPLIADRTLDDILSRVDIAELLGRSMPLKRAGRHFKALCPFHQERTPSFHINTDKQIFHCFGCGAGGNVFSFVMRQERVTFPEAVRLVAEQVGVEVATDPAVAGRQEAAAKLRDILEQTCRYYERMLQHPAYGKTALAYLRTRGVSDEAMRAFRLGCAPEGWDHLVTSSAKAKAPPELLEQAGLLIRTSRGVRDRFRNRLLFPIQDARGRVVGFGGRSLGQDEPKYLNSPETPVYSKGRQLYGLAQAKDAILKAGCAVVVEGYFDCVILSQEGITHVVSPSGTAFTPEQAKLLGRYTDRVILAFDPDAAGQAGTLRGIDVLLEAGLQVQVAQLPSGGDPDELIRSRGRAAFQRWLDESLNILDFLLACATTAFDLRDPEGKVRAMHALILPTLAKLPDAMLRTEYLRLLAERLQLDEHAVRAELSRVKTTATRRGAPEPEAAVPRRDGARGPELALAALVLDDPRRLARIPEAVVEGLTDPGARQVLAAARGCRGDRAGHHAAGVVGDGSAGARSATADGDPTAAQLIARLSEEHAAPLVAELVALAQTVAERERAFEECIERLWKDVHKHKKQAVQAQLQAAQQQGRGTDALVHELQRLINEEKTHGLHETQAR